MLRRAKFLFLGLLPLPCQATAIEDVVNGATHATHLADSAPPPLAAGDKAALLMIEFVNEWLSPRGKLKYLVQDEAPFIHSQAMAAQALHAAREAGMPVIHATLQLSPDYRELGHRRFGLRGAIPRAGTWQKQDDGHRFHPTYAPRPDEFIIGGRAGASAFAASDLDNYLRAQGITRLYLAGYATHVCIESTMRAAHDLGYEPIALTDATAAFTAQQQAYFLREIVHHFGWSMSTEAFVDMLRHDRTTTMDTASPPREAQSRLRAIDTPGQNIPGISSAMVIQGGHLLTLSGHVPIAADGSMADDLEGQLEQVFSNLYDTLRQAGATWANIARMTIYVRDYDPEQLPTIRAVRDRWLGDHAPASTLIGVQALALPGMLVEIDAWGVIDG